MRKLLWTIFAVLFLAIGATNARADTYTLDFTGPSPFTATFDATAGQVTSGVTVTYQGTTYVLTELFGGIGLGASGCGDSAITAGVSLEFLMLTATSIPGCSGLGGTVTADAGLLLIGGILEGTSCQTCPIRDLLGYLGPLAPNATDAQSVFTGATLVSTPEPSSLAFLLAGVGLVFVMRKRLGQGLPQAS